MSDYWDDVINNAGNQSVSDFSENASSLVKLTNKEIEELIPAGVDHAKFAELMKLVNDSAKSNSEKAAQVRNISGFAEIAVNLIAKLA